MSQPSPEAAARSASLRRSLTAKLELAPSGILWGATWACLCGVAAAWPWALEAVSLSRAFVAWLVAVPLAGAVWTTMVAHGRSRGHGAFRATGGDHVSSAVSLGATKTNGRAGEWAARVRHFVASLRRRLATQVDVWGAALAAFGLAALLGPGAVGVLGVALGVVTAAWLMRAAWLAPTGWARSALEILMPAALGWFAMSGARDVAAPIRIYEGSWAAATTWVGANWPFLAVCVAFTIVHRAMTTPSGARRPQRVAELLSGAALAVAVLALANRPLGAGLVALLFVVLWPTHGLLLRGRADEHFRASQWWVMAAMLVACAAAGIG